MENTDITQFTKIIEESKLEKQKLQNANKQQVQFIQNLETKIKDLNLMLKNVETQAEISKKKIDEQKEKLLRDASNCSGCKRPIP